MLSPATPPQFLSGTKLFIKGSHQIVTMKPGRNTRTETCFIMGKAGVSLEFRIWGRRLQGGWRAHALHESSAWGAPQVGGWTVVVRKSSKCEGQTGYSAFVPCTAVPVTTIRCCLEMAGALRSQRTPSHLGSHHWSTGAHWLTHGQHCCPWADPCLCVSTDPGVHLDLDGKTSSQGWWWSSQMHSWTPEAVAAGWCQSHSRLAACGSSCLL